MENLVTVTEDEIVIVTTEFDGLAVDLAELEFDVTGMLGTDVLELNFSVQVVSVLTAGVLDGTYELLDGTDELEFEVNTPLPGVLADELDLELNTPLPGVLDGTDEVEFHEYTGMLGLLDVADELLDGTDDLWLRL